MKQMMYCVVINITPEIAEEYLRKNTSNYRKYRPSIAKRYADDMKNNRWKINGESICFNTKGELINGQHRLQAIIMSGITVPTVVVFDVADEVVTYDVGLKRTTVDIARAADPNRSYTTNLLAIASLFVNSFASNTNSSEKVSEYATKHYDLLYEAMRVGRTSMGQNLSTSGSNLAAYIWLRSGIPTNILETFFSVVNSGFQVEGIECSSAICLRNQVLSSPRKNATISKELYCSAWLAINDFLHEKPRRIRYKMDEKPFEDLKKYQAIDNV